MNKLNLQVALYARVSKEEKDIQGKMYQEPENQLKPLRDYCKQMGWKIKFEFVDRKSGADSNRPEFQNMLTEARQHHFDLLLVWAIDRFSREPILNTLKYLETLKLNNIFLKSLTENIDTRDSGASELIMLIMMWLAREEREKIARRTKAGIQRRKNLGVWKGGRPSKKKGGS